MRALLLLLLLGCTAPDSYTVGTGVGHSDFEGRDTDFDTAAVTAGVTWSPGDRARHKESLEAIRRLEVTTATGNLQPVTVNTAPQEEDDSLVDAALKVPKTIDDAILVLLGLGALLLLVCIYALAKRFGVLEKVPGLRKKE